MSERDEAAGIAAQAGIPERLFDELIGSQSGWNPYALGELGQVGLGGLSAGAYEALGVDPFNPTDNLRGSARYLKAFYDKYGNWRDALSAFKTGDAGSAAGQDFAAQMMGAAGVSDEKKSEPASPAWSWSNPWPWLKARGLDIGFGALGVVLIIVGIVMLTKTGGAFMQGLREGAAQGAAEARGAA